MNVNLTDRTIVLNPTISSSTTKLPTDFIYSVRSENGTYQEESSTEVISRPYFMNALLLRY